MTRKSTFKLNDQELRRILRDMDDFEAIQPLTEEEIAEIEKSPDVTPISLQRRERQKDFLEELRREWVENRESFGTLFEMARAKGFSTSELARSLHLNPEILLKLDLRLISDLPAMLFYMLASLLDQEIHSIYIYLSSSADDLSQVAASSLNKPAVGKKQPWREIIVSSKLPEEDKAYWLKG